MSRTQTRRGVSLNRALYERLVDEAHREGKSVAHYLSDLALVAMDKAGRPFEGGLSHESPRNVERMKTGRWLSAAARKRRVDIFMSGASPKAGAR